MTMPDPKSTTSRRPQPIIMVVAIAGLLSSCAATTKQASSSEPPAVDRDLQAMYGAMHDGDTLVPAIDVSRMDRRNVRQVVDYRSPYPPGTIVVDPYARFLYLVAAGGKAMRYRVGVAKAGLEFTGEARIERKGRWPGWVPTPSMIKRNPERYAPLASGVKGGIGNPLGARALYLYKNGRDTLYRIHGTNEPWSIGKSVSSGCIRLLNQDIIDLHGRVPKGARVVVLSLQQSQGEKI